MEKKTPRPHQVEAIAAAIKHYETANLGSLIMACGTGKTFTALCIAQELEAKTIIVGVPSLALQDQYCGCFLAEMPQNQFDILVIGSDKSIQKAFDVHVTTSISEISDFLFDGSQKPKVIFTTYQSTPALFEAAKGITFDFAIIDEAHRTAGNELSLFSGIVSESNISIKKRLFMTATPRFFKNDTLLSMNDENVFGKHFYSLSTDAAIAKGILCDYKILLIYVENPKVTDLLTHNKKRQHGEVVASSRYFGLATALKMAIDKYEMKRVVTFHKNVAVAQKMEEIIQEVLPPQYEGFHINYKHNMAYRKLVLGKMQKSDIGIITNAKALGEGWDMPECDGVVFVDTRKSSFEVIQAIGRVLRRHETKTTGYVLLPVFMDEKGLVNPEDFDNIRLALSSIGVMDSRVRDYVKKGISTGEQTGDDDIIGHVGGAKFSQINLEIFTKNLSFRTWDRLKMLYKMPYEDARAFTLKLKRFGVNTQIDWHNWRFRHGFENAPRPPDEMPSNPQMVYEDFSWIHFLDKKMPRQNNKDWASYEEAKVFIQKYMAENNILGVKSFREFAKNDKNFPTNIPLVPEVVYKDQWVDFYVFFGKENPNSRDLERLKEYAATLSKEFGIDSSSKWVKWAKGRIPNTPPKPDWVLGNPARHPDFKGYPDFFGRSEKLKKRSSKI